MGPLGLYSIMLMRYTIMSMISPAVLGLGAAEHAPDKGKRLVERDGGIGYRLGTAGGMDGWIR